MESGPVLLESYNGSENESKRRELIELGDLSCLGASIAPSPAVEMFGFSYRFDEHYLALSEHTRMVLEDDNQGFAYTVAYHRDRGEEKQMEHYRSFDALLMDVKAQGLIMIEYVYVWRAGNWWVTWSGMDEQEFLRLDNEVSDLSD